MAEGQDRHQEIEAATEQLISPKLIESYDADREEAKLTHDAAGRIIQKYEAEEEIRKILAQRKADSRSLSGRVLTLKSGAELGYDSGLRQVGNKPYFYLTGTPEQMAEVWKELGEKIPYDIEMAINDEQKPDYANLIDEIDEKNARAILSQKGLSLIFGTKVAFKKWEEAEKQSEAEKESEGESGLRTNRFAQDRLGPDVALRIGQKGEYYLAAEDADELAKCLERLGAMRKLMKHISPDYKGMTMTKRGVRELASLYRKMGRKHDLDPDVVIQQNITRLENSPGMSNGEVFVMDAGDISRDHGASKLVFEPSKRSFWAFGYHYRGDDIKHLIDDLVDHYLESQKNIDQAA